MTGFWPTVANESNGWKGAQSPDRSLHRRARQPFVRARRLRRISSPLPASREFLWRFGAGNAEAGWLKPALLDFLFQWVSEFDQ